MSNPGFERLLVIGSVILTVAATWYILAVVIR